jgi:DnaJ-class molecular chaperone
VCPLHHEKIRHRGSADQADVVVTIETKPHPLFQRKGDHDLTTSRGVNLYELCVGGSLTLELLSGEEMSVTFGPLTGGDSTIKISAFPGVRVMLHVVICSSPSTPRPSSQGNSVP